jgi:serine/threonine protein kinase
MTPAPPDLEGILSDCYRIEGELGRGGMATVYLAHDLKHDRRIALKVLDPRFAAPLGPERFQREIRFAARLQHPHILSVHDSGEAAGHLWLPCPTSRAKACASGFGESRRFRSMTRCGSRTMWPARSITPTTKV